MWYKLVGRTPVPCDVREAEIGQHGKRTRVGKREVSTVFLSLDHNHFGDGPPILFETMIFPEAEFCRRYATLDEAEAGHAEAVAMLQADLGEDA